MTDKERQIIECEQKAGKVVFKTCEGVYTRPIEEFCSQPIEGLLYDLNRDEATTYALDAVEPSPRTINDLAVAQVIRYLHEKAYGKQ